MLELADASRLSSKGWCSGSRQHKWLVASAPSLIKCHWIHDGTIRLLFVIAGVCGDCELARDILPEASTQPRLFHHLVFLSINHLQQPQLGEYLTGGNVEYLALHILKCLYIGSA